MWIYGHTNRSLYLCCFMKGKINMIKPETNLEKNNIDKDLRIIGVAHHMYDIFM